MIRKIICIFLIFLSLGVYANKKTKYEVRLGSNIAATILGQYPQSTDLQLIEYVNLVGQSIVQTSGRRDIHYYFTVLESDEPMAIACPGGYIFITKGLIAMLKTESELAGVLAREIAHVNEKHVLKLVDEGGNDTTTMLTQMLMAKHTTSAVAFSEMSKKAVSILLEPHAETRGENQSPCAPRLSTIGTSCGASTAAGSWAPMVHTARTACTRGCAATR